MVDQIELVPANVKSSDMSRSAAFLSPIEEQRNIKKHYSSSNVMDADRLQDSTEKFRMHKTTSIDLSEGKERSDIPFSVRLMIYLSLLGATFFINVDSGIFPAAVLKIEEDL